MEGSPGIAFELLAREAELRRLNEELDVGVAAVQQASAAFHESLAARSNVVEQENTWAGVDLGDDAPPILPQSKLVAPQTAARARHAAVAEQRALEAVRAAQAAVQADTAGASQTPASGGSSRIPTFKSRGSSRGPVPGPVRAGSAGQVKPQAEPASNTSAREADGPGEGVSTVGTDVYIDPDLPMESQVKLLRSHLRVARHELAEARTAAAGSAAEATEAKKTAQAAAEERARLNRAVAAAETALEKARKAASSAEAREGDVRAQLASLNKEQADRARTARAAEGSTAAMDARVARLQEEVDKLKSSLSSERSQAAEVASSLRREVEALAGQVKKLERQRNDLLVAFKKSVRLITVLKRQKLHVEAARLLAFTEEEFAKAVGV